MDDGNVLLQLLFVICTFSNRISYAFNARELNLTILLKVYKLFNALIFFRETFLILNKEKNPIFDHKLVVDNVHLQSKHIFQFYKLRSDLAYRN